MSATTELADALRAGLVGDDGIDAVPSVIELVDLRGEGPPPREVLAVNFHHTPASDARRYAAQLAPLRGACVGADEALLRGLVSGAAPDPGRPVVLPVLYEGYRSSYEVALPLVEALGLTAWFLVPPAFVDCPVAEQAPFAEAHELVPSVDGDPRVAMTWDELRDVRARGHVVCCHTASHVGQDALRSSRDVERELRAPRARLREQLGVDTRTIAFVWGPAWGADPAADAHVAAAGYDLQLSNGRIERLPATSEDPHG